MSRRTLGSSRLRAALLAAVSLAAAPALRAEVEPDAPPPTKLDGLLAAVARPVAEDAVRRLLDQPEVEQAAEALRVVGALWHSGGPHAADGLRELACHGDARVREAALRGLAVLGLRCRVGSRGEGAVRRALEDPDPRVRLAAHEALGRVGGPQDVDGLIAGLASEDPQQRSLSLRTLRALTSERLSPDHARWSYWWERGRATLEAQVAGELQALDEGADDLRAASAWSIIERRGWVLLADAEATAERWMSDWEPERRREGYRLVAALRLGSLGEELLSAARRDARGPAAEACREAQVALGLRAPPEPTPAPEPVTTR